MSKKQKELFFRTNNQIRTSEVRLVGDNVEVGVYDTREALRKADELELDLIEISPNANPPVCKIMDYSKFLYEQKKKQKEQERKNKENMMELKELRFGPNTDEHDFEFKRRHAQKFLQEGDKVRAFVFFKGREINYKEKGEILLLRLATELEEYGVVETLPQLEGNKLILILRPKKNN
jgi:translation initiation factor IF-3